jgi:hypothetical protein
LGGPCALDPDDGGHAGQLGTLILDDNPAP